ncbi:MAG: hypothetical protein WAW90_02890, partial [Minisyncoccia bacterium]
MVSPQLLDYIRQSLATGASKEDISKALITTGWQVSDINEAFASIEGLPSVPQPMQSAPVVTAVLQSSGRLDPIGKLFSDSWSLYKQRLPVLLSILITIIVIAIPSFFLLMFAIENKIWVIYFGVIAISLLLGISAGMASIFAVSKGTGCLDSYRQSIRSFLSLTWVGILFSFVVFGGFVMFIIPGIMMQVWFMFSAFVLIIEDKRGLNALLQSREYVRGYWWAIFGRLWVYSMIMSISLFVLQIVISRAFGTAAGTYAYSFLMMFILPFTLTYHYKIYQNLTALKPSLAATTPTSGRGFLIASGILGLMVPILLTVLAVVFASLISARNKMGQTSTTESSSIVASSTDQSAGTSPVLALAATPYVNTAYDYRITPPAGWAQQHWASTSRENITHEDIEIFSNQSGIDQSSNYASILVGTKPMPATTSALSQHVLTQMAIYGLQQTMPLSSHKLPEISNLYVGSIPGVLVHAFSEGGDRGGPYELFRFEAVKNNYIYTITATANTKDWNTYEALFK